MIGWTVAQEALNKNRETSRTLMISYISLRKETTSSAGGVGNNSSSWSSAFRTSGSAPMEDNFVWNRCASIRRFRGTCTPRNFNKCWNNSCDYWEIDDMIGHTLWKARRRVRVGFSDCWNRCDVASSEDVCANSAWKSVDADSELHRTSQSEECTHL